MALTKVDISMLEDAGSSGQVLTSDGTNWTSAAAAAGGAWTKIATTVASNDPTLGVSGLDSTYDLYCICGSEIISATDNVNGEMRFGDSSGFDSGGTDYQYAVYGSMSGSSWDDREYYTQGASSIRITESAAGRFGTSTGEAFGCVLWLTRPADGTSYPTIGGTCGYTGHGGGSGFIILGGARKSAIVLDRIQIFAASGNIASGRLTVWGVSHA